MEMLLAISAPVAEGSNSVQPLHAPDGFFDGPVSTVAWVIAAFFVVLSLQITGRRLNERTVPALGVFAAFIFAAQMINFPVAGGTSGHVIGAALATVVLGPWAAIVVMTSVVSLQAVIYQDGGLVVLGANLLNMAVIPAFTAYFVFMAGKSFVKSQASLLALAGVAAWASVEAGALAATVMLSMSGTSPFSVAAPAMLGVHALIGLGEALITAGALAVIFNARRDLFRIGRVVPEVSTR
jgi:cobalt/nickel transport system permease protein